MKGDIMKAASDLVGGFTFTECPRWHAGRLWFVDLYVHRVCSVNEDGTDLRTEVQLDAIPAGIGWLPDGRLLVAISDQQRIVRVEPDGGVVPHADLSGVAVGFINDMAVTKDGTAYVGCFGFDLYAGDPVQPGPYMKITPAGEVSVVGEPLYFANGPTIIDETTLLVSESFASRVSQFTINSDGSLSERRDWAAFGPEPTALDLDERYSEIELAADGISAVDAEGAVWVADFTKQHVSRVLPGGEIVDRISTGDLNCFAAELGGADGRTLFLCATPSELDPEIRKNHPESAILAIRVDVPRAG
jgi:sugar lactone lactonase YvrE